MTLNPKSQFQKSPLCKAHVDLVCLPGVHESLQVAMAQMQLNMGAAPDMGTAAAQAWKMQGAKEFISVWLNLAEPAPERKTEPHQNLKPI